MEKKSKIESFAKSIEDRIERIRAEVLEISKLIGISVFEAAGLEKELEAELMEGKNTKNKTGKGIPKYENPDNKGETWSGKGRQPNWIKNKRKDGVELGDMLIKQ
ncbi:H-NS histone family protein [Gemmobacter fulvus]|uniref:H-NS histone family protein n=1 Tax=Gemmobacter fulvus TaxID=2840474 RepID=A0A975P6I4_9RHOB|nr:H-NS histone family protein [Gemmobacter fulvus]MBT9247776.1 H-NS histone family protein [Gemmobacter fulvus]QWK90033.1 H-NS histone family protein [Gemmobacter fulvus]